MATPHAVDLKLDLILSNAPRILRNSTFVIIVRVSTSILGFVAFVTGLGLLISSAMQTEMVDIIFIDAVFEYNDPNAAQIERISALIGSGLMRFGLLLLLISLLTKMILKRNRFILSSCMRWEELR